MMKVVDPHIHLWDTRKVSYPWLQIPRVAFSGDNRRLPQPHGVQEFLQSTSGVDVLMSVNVEANPAEPLAEAQWLQALADDPANRGHPHGIVAHADLSRPDAPALFERLAACRNLRGIRQILNVHPDPRYDYVGRHYLGEAQWRENLRALARYNWSFDLQIYPSQVPAALVAIQRNEDILFVVNHAGMFVDRNRVQGWREWRSGLQKLAACRNAVIKISGLAMFDHDWSVESFRPYVLEVIDTFGSARCMFASNFPIDGLHGSYAALWSNFADIVSGASDAERAGLFRENAIRYYRLQDNKASMANNH
jgi:predicted TIM-barrel fold metal-dependent hydrolase